jgi:hypothetical protein
MKREVRGSTMDQAKWVTVREDFKASLDEIAAAFVPWKA